MANPSRIPDPRLDDPLNPAPIAGIDPQITNPRFDPANRSDPALDNRTVVNQRGGNSGILMAAVVIVLAIAAYFMFAPRNDTSAVVPAEPVATQPAPDAAAPNTMSPADPATPAPNAAAPDATAPAMTAPDTAAPAPAEPAQPAPAQ